MTAWIRKHGAAITTAAAGAGALVANFGGVSPEVTEILNGASAAIGLAGAAVHAFLNGLLAKGHNS